MSARIVLLLTLVMLALEAGASLGDDYFSSWDGRKRYMYNPIQGVSATITTYLRPNIHYPYGDLSSAWCMALASDVNRWAQAGYLRRYNMDDAHVFAQWIDDGGTPRTEVSLVPGPVHTYKCTYDLWSGGIWRFCYDMFPGIEVEFANSSGYSTTWTPKSLEFAGEIRENGNRFCRAQMVGEENNKVKFSNMRYLPVGFCFSTIGCSWETCLGVPKVWPDTEAITQECKPGWGQDATHAPEYFLIWDKTR